MTKESKPKTKKTKTAPKKAKPATIRLTAKAHSQKEPLWFTDGDTSAPSKPNKKGFRSLAAIYNKSAAGAIYETAGRKNPNGQPSQASTKGKYSSYIDTSKKVNKSANPNAGKQFIDAMGQMYKSQRQQGQGGRVSRKMNGRLIFRAWGEDNGKVNAKVIKAIEKSLDKVVIATRGAK